jgi:hypothetical protein
VTSTFPAAPDNIRTDVVNTTAEADTHPDLHNQLASAVNALETSLLTAMPFGAGSAASPSITFAGDLNTGLYNPATDTIGFSTGGVQRVALDSSGLLSTAKISSDVTYVTGVAGQNVRPWKLYTRFNATDTADPYSVISTGVSSAASVGDNGAATVGSVWASGHEVFVKASGNDLNEHAAAFMSVQYNIGAGYTQSVGPAGRGWLIDGNIHGAVGVQQSLLSGINMLINNYYNGQPTSALSVGFAVQTYSASGATDSIHRAATTYPIGAGIAIVGTSTGGTLRGYETGLQIGGAGGGWGIPSSLLGKGITIRDVTTTGVHLTNPAAGSPEAIRIDGPGWSNALVMPNMSGVAASDTGGTPRAILYAHSDNTVRVGWISAPTTNGHLIFYVNGAEGGRFSPGGSLNVVGSTTTTLVDTPLFQPTGNAIEQRNGVNSQSWRIYGTYSSAGANYERLEITPSSIIVQNAGTGVVRTLTIQSNNEIRLNPSNTAVWRINTGGLWATTDNSVDIGVAGNKPRNIFVAGAVANRTKAGTPVDADVNTPTDGMLIVDTTANKIWARCGGTWKGVVIA